MGEDPSISVRHFEKLPSQTCDILIVGSGRGGALMAEHPCDGKREIMLVDRRQPARGGSLATDRIVTKIEKMLGVGLYPPHSRWAAPFGNTHWTPVHGPVPDLPNVHAVMGFGGNGITFSKIAADIIKAEITGEKDRDADLFSFPE